MHKLRTSPAYVRELDFVAEIDGRIVGHIIYSKAKIAENSGVSHEVLTFGPLTVLPSHQGLGIGQALMAHSFEIARQLGYKAVIIFGHPSYYPRAGFKPAREFGIVSDSGRDPDTFMAYELFDGALTGVHGTFSIDLVYEQLPEEETLEFDKSFQPKEPFVPTSIHVLLEKLSPEAAAAIEGTGCESLEMMTSKSEREIACLADIDSESVETIRSLLNAHGVHWGDKNSR